MSDAKEKLAAVMADLGLTVSAEFVPFSQSRNAKPDAKLSERSLNWRVTLERNGKPALTTDYQAGIAHCPAYKRLKCGGPRWTLEQSKAITTETEKGRTSRHASLGILGAPILPDPLDVVYSLAADASVLDYASFEIWATEYGYETDSRKAEAIYSACMKIALQLRAAIGDAGIEALNDAAADY